MLGLYIQEGSGISGYQSRERLGHWVFHTQGGISGALLIFQKLLTASYMIF